MFSIRPRCAAAVLLFACSCSPGGVVSHPVVPVGSVGKGLNVRLGSLGGARSRSGWFQIDVGGIERMLWSEVFCKLWSVGPRQSLKV